MTRWIRTALTCSAAAFGLVFLAPVASADEPPVTALPNSGTLTWHLIPVGLECSDWPSGATCAVR